MSQDDGEYDETYRPNPGLRTGPVLIGGAINKPSGDPPPPVPLFEGQYTCNRCKVKTYLLHSSESAPGRPSICGKCQGEENRKIQDQIRDAVRVLKQQDDPGAVAVIRKYFSDWKETVDAIKRSREGGKSSTAKGGFY